MKKKNEGKSWLSVNFVFLSLPFFFISLSFYKQQWLLLQLTESIKFLTIYPKPHLLFKTRSALWQVLAHCMVLGKWLLWADSTNSRLKKSSNHICSRQTRTQGDLCYGFNSRSPQWPGTRNRNHLSRRSLHSFPSGCRVDIRCERCDWQGTRGIWPIGRIFC